MAADPGRSFAGALTAAFAAAGRPTLKSVAAGAARRGELVGVKVPSGLHARIGEWRSGRHLPREFDGLVEFTVAELLARMRAAGTSDPDVPTDMRQWRALWQSSVAAAAEPTVVPDESPWPGLASYGQSDADQFFGRETAVAEIRSRVDDALAAGGGLVAVAGVSGVGKSSVLRAGLAAGLVADGGVGVVVTTPGDDPLGAVTDLIGGRTPRDAARAWAAARGVDRVVVVIDQAEELFTAVDDADRTRFVELLAEVVEPDGGDVPVAVVLGIRADFLGQWSEIPQVRDALNRRLFVLGPMCRNELATVISGPLDRMELDYDPALPERICDDLCGIASPDYEPGMLPLLSHALTAAWARRGGPGFTYADYRSVGGVTGSLTATAERLWEDLDAPRRDVLQRMMIQLVNLGDGTRDTRRRVPRDDLLAAVGDGGEEVLDRLVDARLVAVDDADEVSVVHEIVLEAWPRLRRWFDADRASLLTLQQVRGQAAEWRRASEDRGLLLRGGRLAAATAAARMVGGELGDDVTEFLDASARNRRRGILVRRVGLAVLTLVTIAAIVSTVVAWSIGRSAARDRVEAMLRQVEAQADQLIGADPSAAAQLALAAYREDPSTANRYRVLATAVLPLQRSVQTGAGALYTLAVSPNSRDVAVAAEDDSVRIFRIDHDPSYPAAVAVATLTGHTGFVTSVAWAGDDRLASTSDDGTIRVWDRSADGEWIAGTVLRGHDGRVVYAAFSPDGNRLVSGGMDGTARVWDVRSAREIAVLGDHAEGVRTVAWSPDGARIATGSDDRTGRLWDGATYAPRGVLTGHGNTVHSVAFSPDSRFLATGSDDASAALWDLARPEEPVATISGHTSALWSVAYSPDGTRLLTTSLDGTATVWNIATPSNPVKIGHSLTGAGGALYSGAFVAGSGQVLTSGVDGSLRLWTLPTDVLTGHSARVVAPAFAADRMVTGGFDGMLTVWDVADPTAPRGLARSTVPGGAPVYEVAFAPDGDVFAAATGAGRVVLYRMDAAGRPAVIGGVDDHGVDQHHAAFSPAEPILATSRGDGALALWDVTDPARPRELGTLRHGDRWLTAVAWSADGQRIATTGQDGVILVWDVADPERPRRVAQARTGSGTLSSLAWNTAGDELASGDAEGRIGLWTVDGDAVVPSGAMDDSSALRTVVFVGDQLLSSGDGSVLRVWDVAEPSAPAGVGEVATLPGRRWSLASKGDELVGAGGDAGAAVLLPLDTDAVIDRICRAAGPLDETEWDRYATVGFSHRDICP